MITLRSWEELALLLDIGFVVGWFSVEVRK